MSIKPILAFKDNYIWQFSDDKTTWVVDPGDANPVLEMLQKNNLQLAGILLTHHHNDHSGGIQELLNHFKNIEVIGAHNSQIETINHRVHDGDEFTCGALRLKALAIPGHTLDHTAYYNDEILFCGDTLFSAGCGRVFEGTPAQMYQSLQKLAALPEKIKIYCGHEYTLANLNFAKIVEPDNQAIIKKLQTVTELNQKNLPTLPSLLSEEKQINPFLRCHLPEVRAAVSVHVKKELQTPVEVFTYLREWKNNL